MRTKYGSNRMGSNWAWETGLRQVAVFFQPCALLKRWGFLPEMPAQFVTTDGHGTYALFAPYAEGRRRLGGWKSQMAKGLCQLCIKCRGLRSSILKGHYRKRSQVKRQMTCPWRTWRGHVGNRAFLGIEIQHFCMGDRETHQAIAWRVPHCVKVISFRAWNFI